MTKFLLLINSEDIILPDPGEQGSERYDSWNTVEWRIEMKHF